MQLRVKEQILAVFKWEQILSDLTALLNSICNEQIGVSPNLVVRSVGNKHFVLFFQFKNFKKFKLWVLNNKTRCLNINL